MPILCVCARLWLVEKRQAHAAKKHADGARTHCSPVLPITADAPADVKKEVAKKEVSHVNQITIFSCNEAVTSSLLLRPPTLRARGPGVAAAPVHHRT